MWYTCGTVHTATAAAGTAMMSHEQLRVISFVSCVTCGHTSICTSAQSCLEQMTTAAAAVTGLISQTAWLLHQCTRTGAVIACQMMFATCMTHARVTL